MQPESITRTAPIPTVEGLRARRHEILQVAATYGGSNVHIFGSVARGEADEKSDVDLLVDFDDTVRGGFAQVGRMLDLGEELSALLGVHVDVLNGVGVRRTRELVMAGKQTMVPSRRRMLETILGDAVPL